MFIAGGIQRQAFKSFKIYTHFIILELDALNGGSKSVYFISEYKVHSPACFFTVRT